MSSVIIADTGARGCELLGGGGEDRGWRGPGVVGNAVDGSMRCPDEPGG